MKIFEFRRRRANGFAFWLPTLVLSIFSLAIFVGVVNFNQVRNFLPRAAEAQQKFELSASGFEPRERVSAIINLADGRTIAGHGETAGFKGEVRIRATSDPSWPVGKVRIIAHGENSNHEEILDAFFGEQAAPPRPGQKCDARNGEYFDKFRGGKRDADGNPVLGDEACESVQCTGSCCQDSCQCGGTCGAEPQAAPSSAPIPTGAVTGVNNGPECTPDSQKQACAGVLEWGKCKLSGLSDDQCRKAAEEAYSAKEKQLNRQCAGNQECLDQVKRDHETDAWEDLAKRMAAGRAMTQKEIEEATFKSQGECGSKPETADQTTPAAAKCVGDIVDAILNPKPPPAPKKAPAPKKLTVAAAPATFECWSLPTVPKTGLTGKETCTSKVLTTAQTCLVAMVGREGKANCDAILAKNVAQQKYAACFLCTGANYPNVSACSSVCDGVVLKKYNCYRPSVRSDGAKCVAEAIPEGVECDKGEGNNGGSDDPAICEGRAKNLQDVANASCSACKTKRCPVNSSTCNCNYECYGVEPNIQTLAPVTPSALTVICHLPDPNTGTCQETRLLPSACAHRTSQQCQIAAKAGYDLMHPPTPTAPAQTAVPTKTPVPPTRTPVPGETAVAKPSPTNTPTPTKTSGGEVTTRTPSPEGAGTAGVGSTDTPAPTTPTPTRGKTEVSAPSPTPTWVNTTVSALCSVFPGCATLFPQSGVTVTPTTYYGKFPQTPSQTPADAPTVTQTPDSGGGGSFTPNSVAETRERDETAQARETPTLSPVKDWLLNAWAGVATVVNPGWTPTTGSSNTQLPKPSSTPIPQTESPPETPDGGAGGGSPTPTATGVVADLAIRAVTAVFVGPTAWLPTPGTFTTTPNPNTATPIPRDLPSSTPLIGAGAPGNPPPSKTPTANEIPTPKLPQRGYIDWLLSSVGLTLPIAPKPPSPTETRTPTDVQTGTPTQTTTPVPTEVVKRGADTAVPTPGKTPTPESGRSEAGNIVRIEDVYAPTAAAPNPTVANTPTPPLIGAGPEEPPAKSFFQSIWDSAADTAGFIFNPNGWMLKKTFPSLSQNSQQAKTIARNAETPGPTETRTSTYVQTGTPTQTKTPVPAPTVVRQGAETAVPTPDKTPTLPIGAGPIEPTTPSQTPQISLPLSSAYALVPLWWLGQAVGILPSNTVPTIPQNQASAIPAIGANNPAANKSNNQTPNSVSPVPTDSPALPTPANPLVSSAQWLFSLGTQYGISNPSLPIFGTRAPAAVPVPPTGASITSNRPLTLSECIQRCGGSPSYCANDCAQRMNNANSGQTDVERIGGKDYYKCYVLPAGENRCVADYVPVGQPCIGGWTDQSQCGQMQTPSGETQQVACWHKVGSNDCRKGIPPTGTDCESEDICRQIVMEAATRAKSSVSPAPSPVSPWLVGAPKQAPAVAAPPRYSGVDCFSLPGESKFYNCIQEQQPEVFSYCQDLKKTTPMPLDDCLEATRVEKPETPTAIQRVAQAIFGSTKLNKPDPMYMPLPQPNPLTVLACNPDSKYSWCKASCWYAGLGDGGKCGEAKVNVNSPSYASCSHASADSCAQEVEFLLNERGGAKKTPTLVPTATPTNPKPSLTPTNTPTLVPSETPTVAPSQSPTSGSTGTGLKPCWSVGVARGCTFGINSDQNQCVSKEHCEVLAKSYSDACNRCTGVSCYDDCVYVPIPSPEPTRTLSPTPSPTPTRQPTVTPTQTRVSEQTDEMPTKTPDSNWISAFFDGARDVFRIPKSETKKTKPSETLSPIITPSVTPSPTPQPTQTVEPTKTPTSVPGEILKEFFSIVSQNAKKITDKVGIGVKTKPVETPVPRNPGRDANSGSVNPNELKLSPPPIPGEYEPDPASAPVAPSSRARSNVLEAIDYVLPIVAPVTNPVFGAIYSVAPGIIREAGGFVIDSLFPGQ